MAIANSKSPRNAKPLENVLVPYRLEEDFELFLSSGFSFCDLFFKWYNFCGMIAVK
jgi:tRNA (cmo5U34)-methyltransferase